MLFAIALLVLALLFVGVGFVIHFLWILAVIAFLVWIIGFFVRHGERSWYRW